MEALEALRQGLTLAELAKGLAISVVLARFPMPLPRNGKHEPSSWSIPSELIKTSGFFFIFLAARSWLALVDRYVPEPYLDEVFHIPQAQTYCEGRFRDWDDKITTPPGLYLLSVAYHKLWMLTQCTPSSLRSNNLLATLLTALLASQCRHLVEVCAAEREGKEVPQRPSFYSFHTGINIALFPVIFFFSALYYTDIISTLAVLLAYRNHLLRLGPETPGVLSDLWTVVLGVAALFMRQTNIFWVVVYMGGLEAVHSLRSVKPAAQGPLTKVYDPPLSEAGPDDWLFCVLSIAVTAIYNPLKVLRQIWPHITVLALFAGFVAWNGGVVLGDKSNHIATIHLAQMLYIWPFFAFFSAPLLLPSVFRLLTNPPRFLHPHQPATTRSALLTAANTLLATLLSLAVVKYNTIIHPFTLADNRHYMFYVFRHTILRSNPIRLALVVPYTLCRSLAWDTLAGAGDTHLSKPSASTDTTTTTTQPAKTQTPVTAPTRNPVNKENHDQNANPTIPETSTTILFLLATALSLITAPLVEPRYFILPWVFYRLLVPPSQTFNLRQLLQGWFGNKKISNSWVGRVDLRLVLETAWFVVVNAGTMYVFLTRPFYWRGEDGEVVDGGRVQRFMW